MVDDAVKTLDALKRSKLAVAFEINLYVQRRSLMDVTCLSSNNVTGVPVLRRPNASTECPSASSICVLGKYVMMSQIMYQAPAVAIRVIVTHCEVIV